MREKSSGLVILNDLKVLKQGPVDISATDGNIRCADQETPGVQTSGVLAQTSFYEVHGDWGGGQPVGRKAYPADKHFYLIPKNPHAYASPLLCVVESASYSSISIFMTPLIINPSISNMPFQNKGYFHQPLLDLGMARERNCGLWPIDF